MRCFIYIFGEGRILAKSRTSQVVDLYGHIQHEVLREG